MRMYRPRCGAEAVSFGWDRLLGNHSSRDRQEICKQKAHQTRVGDEWAHKKLVKGKKWTAVGINRPLEY